MGRPPNTQARREQIVAALREELAAVGYERASTKSIAARANLTPGLIHYHFSSKEEILLSLVEGLIRDARRRFDRILVEDSPAREKLEAFVTSMVGLGRTSDREKVRTWVTIIAEAMGQTKVRNRVAKWLGDDLDRLAALFRNAGAAEPVDKAAALLALILGSFSLHAIRVAQAPPGYAERQILRWLDGALPG